MNEPERKGNSQRFSLNPGQTISITASAFPRFSYGQTLKISGTIKQRLLKDNRIVNTMFFPKITIKKEEADFPQNLIFHAREKIHNVFQATLPPISASLLFGIVFGGKEQMPKSFSNNLATVGLMHIIAASGMNVTMVAAAAFFIFAKFFRRQLAIILSILGIFFYMLLAGFSPSIIRAAIMACLAFTAALIGRQYLALFALGFTGYLMLFFHPSLLFDLGFQLSFMATLGIILLVPLLSGKKKEKENNAVVESVFTDMTTTTAAQIATLPILLTTFGQYGLFSIPVNALVLWMVPILMTLGGLAAIFSLILPVVAKLFLWLALPFLIYLEYIVMYFGKLNMNISLEKFPAAFMLGYYLLLVAVIVYKRKAKNF